MQKFWEVSSPYALSAARAEYQAALSELLKDNFLQKVDLALQSEATKEEQTKQIWEANLIMLHQVTEVFCYTLQFCIYITKH